MPIPISAQALVFSVGPSRPFVPPIHVLVFPSQVPQDLRLAVRGFGFDLQVRTFSQVTLLLPSFYHVQDESETVEHMNILPASQALDHVCFPPFHGTGTDTTDGYDVAEHESMA